MTGPFVIGEIVRVGDGLPPGHVRTPLFLRGKTGTVLRHFGTFPNPERLAYGLSGNPKLHLYQVVFTMEETWGGDGAYALGDTVTVDLYESWLERP